MENFSKLNCPDKILKKFLRTRIIVGNKISFAWRLSVFLQKIVRNETDVFCLIFEDYPHAVLNFNTVFMLRTEASIFVKARIYLQNYSIHFNCKFTSLNSNHFSRWSVFWVNKCTKIAKMFTCPIVCPSRGVGNRAQDCIMRFF